MSKFSFSRFPEFREFSFVGKCCNLGTVYAARFGQRLTFEEAVLLHQFFENEGLTCAIRALGKGYKLIVRDNSTIPSDIRDAMWEAGVEGLRKEQAAEKARVERHERYAKLLSKRLALLQRSSYSFLEEYFGEVTEETSLAAVSNLTALADYLEGCVKKYQGIIGGDLSWREVADKIGIVAETESQLLPTLKRVYEEGVEG